MTPVTLADVNAENSFGQSALWIAASLGHERFVRLILEAGGNAPSTDELIRLRQYMLSCGVPHAKADSITTSIAKSRK
jgi:ankyrin repeat protein